MSQSALRSSEAQCFFMSPAAAATMTSSTLSLQLDLHPDISDHPRLSNKRLGIDTATNALFVVTQLPSTTHDGDEVARVKSLVESAPTPLLASRIADQWYVIEPIVGSTRHAALPTAEANDTGKHPERLTEFNRLLPLGLSFKVRAALISDWMHQLFDIVEELHQRGLTCWNIRPKNILIDSDGRVTIANMLHRDNIFVNNNDAEEMELRSKWHTKFDLLCCGMIFVQLCCATRFAEAPEFKDERVSALEWLKLTVAEKEQRDAARLREQKLQRQKDERELFGSGSSRSSDDEVQTAGRVVSSSSGDDSRRDDLQFVTEVQAVSNSFKQFLAKLEQRTSSRLPHQLSNFVELCLVSDPSRIDATIRDLRNALPRLRTRFDDANPATQFLGPRKVSLPGFQFANLTGVLGLTFQTREICTEEEEKEEADAQWDDRASDDDHDDGERRARLDLLFDFRQNYEILRHDHADMHLVIGLTSSTGSSMTFDENINDIAVDGIDTNLANVDGNDAQSERDEMERHMLEHCAAFTLIDGDVRLVAVNYAELVRRLMHEGATRLIEQARPEDLDEEQNKRTHARAIVQSWLGNVSNIEQQTPEEHHANVQEEEADQQSISESNSWAEDDDADVNDNADDPACVATLRLPNSTSRVEGSRSSWVHVAGFSSPPTISTIDVTLVIETWTEGEPPSNACRGACIAESQPGRISLCVDLRSVKPAVIKHVALSSGSDENLSPLVKQFRLEAVHQLRLEEKWRRIQERKLRDIEGELERLQQRESTEQQQRQQHEKRKQELEQELREIRNALDWLGVSLSSSKKVPAPRGSHRIPFARCFGAKYTRYGAAEDLLLFNEYLHGGTLYDIRQRFDFDEMQIRKIARDVLEALVLLHEPERIEQGGKQHKATDNVFAHLHLKPDNLMMCPDGAVRLIDFGESREFEKRDGKWRVRDDEMDSKRQSFVQAFAPPEMCCNRHIVSPKVDVWGLGTMLLKFITNETPFDDKAICICKTIHKMRNFDPLLHPFEQQSVQQQQRVQATLGVLSPQCHAFIRRCMTVQRKDRPTALELMDDPWFFPDAASRASWLSQSVTTDLHQLVTSHNSRTTALSTARNILASAKQQSLNLAWSDSIATVCALSSTTAEVADFLRHFPHRFSLSHPDALSIFGKLARLRTQQEQQQFSISELADTLISVIHESREIVYLSNTEVESQQKQQLITAASNAAALLFAPRLAGFPSPQVDLSGCVLHDCNLAEADLTTARFAGHEHGCASLFNCDFSWCMIGENNNKMSPTVQRMLALSSQETRERKERQQRREQTQKSEQHERLEPRHTNSVACIALSPDGTELATASSDCTAKLWNTVTGECLQTFSGHTGSVTCVVFSPQQQQHVIATSSADGTVKLWNTETGECLRTLSGHRLSVRSVAFSRDGKLLASCSLDRTVRLWNSESGELKWTADLSNDNNLLVSRLCFVVGDGNDDNDDTLYVCAFASGSNINQRPVVFNAATGARVMNSTVASSASIASQLSSAAELVTMTENDTARQFVRIELKDSGRIRNQGSEKVRWNLFVR